MEPGLGEDVDTAVTNLPLYRIGRGVLFPASYFSRDPEHQTATSEQAEVAEVLAGLASLSSQLASTWPLTFSAVRVPVSLGRGDGPWAATVSTFALYPIATLSFFLMNASERSLSASSERKTLLTRRVTHKCLALLLPVITLSADPCGESTLKPPIGCGTMSLSQSDRCRQTLKQFSPLLSAVVSART